MFTLVSMQDRESIEILVSHMGLKIHGILLLERDLCSQGCVCFAPFLVLIVVTLS